MQQQGGDSLSNKISDMDWSIGGFHSNQRSGVRFGSSSSQTSQNSGDICRICHCESETQNPLLTPCYCSGSLKYVHQSCLQQWLTASETTSCELCKFPFIMHTKIKPFNEWRALQMSGIERRRLFCSVLFHCAAATCVIWSLCVLIERATEEVKRGLISWPFWTKLVVVTVGLTGGVVFMYIQCKAYLSLCTRWRARNRILLIQNAPEKVAPPPSQHSLDLRDESPPLPMFNRNVGTMTGTGTPGRLSNTSGMALNRSVYSAASHGQIVANIESRGGGCSSRQSRDWTGNVYVEDLGGFHSDDGGFRCVEESATTSHGNVFKNPSPQPQLVTSSNVMVAGGAGVFVETPEIIQGNIGQRLFEGGMVNPQQQQQIPCRSKFNRQRHSLWVDTTSANHDGMGNANQSDFRRYSDTRLIIEPHEMQQQLHYDQQIFNVATAVQGPPSSFGYHQHHHHHHNMNSGSQSNSNINTNTNNNIRRTTASGTTPGGHHQHHPLAMEDSSSSSSHCIAMASELDQSPQITDILFREQDSSFDPLELNIQELLELDIRTNVHGRGVCDRETTSEYLHGSQLSVNSDPLKYFKGQSEGGEEGEGQRRGTQAEQKHLLTPQSLPNLSASSENLLMQQRRGESNYDQQQSQHHPFQ